MDGSVYEYLLCFQFLGTIFRSHDYFHLLLLDLHSSFRGGVIFLQLDIPDPLSLLSSIHLVQHIFHIRLPIKSLFESFNLLHTIEVFYQGRVEVLHHICQLIFDYFVGKPIYLQYVFLDLHQQ